MKKIYFCKKNNFKTKALYKALKILFPDKKIKRKDCLGKCKTCKQCPFLLVDGENVSGRSLETLYFKTFKHIEKESS